MWVTIFTVSSQWNEEWKKKSQVSDELRKIWIQIQKTILASPQSFAQQQNGWNLDNHFFKLSHFFGEQ